MSEVKDVFVLQVLSKILSIILIFWLNVQV